VGLYVLLYAPFCFSEDAVRAFRHPFDPNVLSSKIYAEIYTLNALYDDQTFIQTKMILTNIGLGDSNAACELLVLHVGEKPDKTSKRFKKTSWKYSSEHNPTLSIGSCSLEQDGKSTSCTMTFDKIMATFFLSSSPRYEKSPDTILAGTSSKRFYTDEVLIPWTGLKTTLRRQGNTEKQLQGFGMLEHSRSVGYPKDFSRGWISYYGCRPGVQFLANFHFPSCKEPCAVGRTWNSLDEAPKALSGLRMSIKGSTICTKESLLPVVSAPDPTFAIAGKQRLFRFSIVDELGPILGCIVKLIVGNPVTRYYWAQAIVSPDQPPTEGILEVMSFE
jgi:catechol 2,3-dioxygenase-like lactoylglutathione lyase family enzyme